MKMYIKVNTSFSAPGVRFAKRILCGNLKLANEFLGWGLEVTNEIGKRIYSVRFIPNISLKTFNMKGKKVGEVRFAKGNELGYEIVVKNKKTKILQVEYPMTRGLFFPDIYRIKDLNWEIKRNIWGNSYKIFQNGEFFAEIRRTSWYHNYELNIKKDVDKLLVLQAALFVDFYSRHDTLGF